MSTTKLKTMMTGTNTADPAFFTPTVKPLLGRFNSSEHCDQIKSASMKTQLGASEMAFISSSEWFYLAAMGQDGWPYTQRHCGPKGFLRALGSKTVGFASPAGSQRYVSDGAALLFLIDHASHARLRIWADAEVSEDPATMQKLLVTGRSSPLDQLAILFRVRGFAWGDELRAMQRSAAEVHSTEAAGPANLDPLSTNPTTTERCLSLDGATGVWTLTAHRVGVRI